MCARGSFPLDVGGLDDGPPFLDLSFLKRPEGLWRLLLARKCLLPNIGKPSLHSGFSQGGNNGAI